MSLNGDEELVAEPPVSRPERPRRVRRRAMFVEEEPKPSEWRFFWVALFGFYILLTETGVRQIMNQFVTPIQETYNCTKEEADTAMLMIPTSSSFIAGPICSFFYQGVGARISIVIGAILCFSGFILCSLEPPMIALWGCTFAIGIGFCLMRISIISVQCEYFKKKRNSVMSFILIGPGMGIFILPRIIKWISDYFESWKPVFWFIASLYIVSGTMGLFLNKGCSTNTASLCSSFMFKVWKRLEFSFHLLASFFATVVVMIYLSNILKLMELENMENPQDIYSYQGIAGIAGKVIMTIIMERNYVSVPLLAALTYIIAQVSLFSGAFCFTLWQFRLQNFFAGFGTGLYQAVQSPFIVAVVGASQFPSALGYTNFINGVSVIFAIKASAWYTDDDELRIRETFYFAMYCGLFAMVIAIINSIMLSIREKHKRKPSMKQMRHSSELNALANINSAENV